MQLSTRGRYAVMAMVDLAVAAGAHAAAPCGAGLPVGDRRQPAAQPVLSGAVVRQAAARRAGDLGARPGRRLPAGAPVRRRSASPTIVAAVDEPIRATRCETGELAAAWPAPVPAAPGERCQTHDLWYELGRQISLVPGGRDAGRRGRGGCAGGRCRWTGSSRSALPAAEPLAAN